MQKRLSDLLQAFEHCRFEECLRMSDQILKKMDKQKDKKKQTMNQLDLLNLYLTRVGSLAATGHVHDANQLIQQKFKQPIISPQSSFLFLQICTLAIDHRLSDFIMAINDKKQKKQIDINRFLFLTHKFSVLSRIFLRKFANQKQNKDSISQIYLQYLQQLQQQKMIKYERDRTIRENKNLNFKFVMMFLQKFITTFKAVQVPKQKVQMGYHNKISVAIADLKFKMNIHSGNSAVVRKLLQQYEKDITKNIYVYLRSLKCLESQKDINEIVWRQTFLKIFRNNLNLDNYQPIYDYSLQFINQLAKQPQFDFSLASDPIKITQQQLYIYKQNKKQQLQNYINSLFTEYVELRDKQKENKKKDFYKIATKNCLLLLINILFICKKYELIRKFLIQYKQQNGRKLTFSDQIYKYFTSPQIFTNQYFQQFKKAPHKLQNVEDKLIWEINYQKLYCKNPLKFTLQQNMKEWQRLHQLYNVNVKQIEKLKTLQKGQRYLSDQFLTLQADYIRKYTQQIGSGKLTQIQRQELYYYILGQLEQAISRSPYNHDNKLRAVYYYNKLNYYEEAIKTLQSMDIKAVQFQTLGYFYLKNFINACCWDANEQLLVRMIRSYQQNYRESSQYAFKALVSTSFNECEENLCYGEHIDRSYNLLVLFYVFYMKNKGKQNASFYLKQILYRINQNKGRITFNSDFKIIKNVIDPNGQPFVDFYGIYNNKQILENQCKIKLLLLNLVSGTMNQQQQQQLKKSVVFIQNVAQIYNFSQYIFFQKKLEYTYNGQYHHQLATAVQLKISNMVNKIMLKTYQFVVSLRKQGNLNEQDFENLKKQVLALSQQISKLTWRQQIILIPSVRFEISEIIPVLAHQVETYSNKKKKVEGQAQKKQACQQLINLFLQSVSENIKLQERLKINKKFMKPEFVHRDELLERMTKMNANQYKKLYKIKI